MSDQAICREESACLTRRLHERSCGQTMSTNMSDKQKQSTAAAPTKRWRFACAVGVKHPDPTKHRDGYTDAHGHWHEPHTETLLVPPGEWVGSDLISEEDALKILSRWGSWEDHESRLADVEAQRKARASGIRTIR